MKFSKARQPDPDSVAPVAAAHSDRTSLPRRKLRWRTALGGAAIAVAVAGAFAAGEARPSKPDAYADTRIAIINGHLRDAQEGYVLLAGDSHAELLAGAGPICGRPAVNAGVSGATAETYVAALARIEPPRRASLAVLSLGANNLLRKRKPLADASLAGFRAAVGDSVRRLHAMADSVVVLAIPPITPDRGDFASEAAATYDDALGAACREAGCLFLDPFASERNRPGPAALPGDGVHLPHYRGAASALAGRLCPR